jgi:hypothetical protein
MTTRSLPAVGAIPALRLIEISGGGVDWAVRRRGPFGWTIRRSDDGSLLATMRYGSLGVAGDLGPRSAALIVALVEAHVVSAVSPFVWLGGW